MAVIKEIKYDQAVITIHDDYCKDKTEEEIQEIINNVTRRINEFYISQAASAS